MAGGLILKRNINISLCRNVFDLIWCESEKTREIIVDVCVSSNNFSSWIPKMYSNNLVPGDWIDLKPIWISSLGK